MGLALVAPFRWGDAVTRHPDAVAACLGWSALRGGESVGETMRTVFGVKLQPERFNPRRLCMEPAFLIPTPYGAYRVVWPMDEPPVSDWAASSAPTLWYGVDQAARIIAGTPLRRVFLAADEVAVWQLTTRGLPAVCPVFEGKDRRLSEDLLCVLEQLVPHTWRLIVTTGERGEPLARKLRGMGVDAGVLNTCGRSVEEWLLALDTANDLARAAA